MALGDEAGGRGGVQGGVPPGVVSPAWLWSERAVAGRAPVHPAVRGLPRRQKPWAVMPAEGKEEGLLRAAARSRT